jgi:nitrite reductase/ring-hydroxylating ferredoxin subunit
MGELLRRYWHPIGLTADATATPRKVRVLGEDLILFRDGNGRAGLLYPRCAHRGSSLYYGHVDEQGIRCCYHGWLFDVEGRCLEKPCEPDCGASSRERTRQPWYPVEERYGLVFAYLGPPSRKPVLPRYDILEEVGPGETIEADDTSIGSGGPAVVQCNWLQHFENIMDPFHVPVLHASFSGNQFTPNMAVMPKVTFEFTPRGVRSIQFRDLGEGRIHRRITEAVHPTIRAVASPRAEVEGRCTLLGWVLPIDDTSFRIYTAGRVKTPGELKHIRSLFAGRTWFELSEDEHQQFPGDYEAQVSQGPVTFHSEEHLAASDQGIMMLRAVLKKQLRVLALGEDPIGVTFSPEAALVRLDAGTSIEMGQGSCHAVP